MKQEELLRLIEKAFKDAYYPGDKKLVNKESYYSSSEYAYVAEYFKGKHWRNVTLAVLERDYPGPHDACLSFMSDSAARFFLPAYMIIAVQDFDRADVTADSAVHYICRNRAKAQAFAPEQREAIVAFLEYMLKHHPEDYSEARIREAIQSFKAAA